MTRTARNAGIFALALLAVLLGMSVRISFDWMKLVGSARPDPQLAAMRTELSSAQDPFEVFTKVARVVGPSVVSIRGDVYRGEQAGTGVIADSMGHVLTNFHVIDKTDNLTVELSNGRHYRAVLKGGDGVADLAVLEIQDVNVDALQPVVFGDSDAIEVGQSVLAIGNAFELRGTVTHGIISAKSRPVITKTQFIPREGAIPVLDDFIQTDAPINPGNSGGPLVNVHGEVIGINTLIYSRTGSSAGIGFAIPSNYAKQVLRQILDQKNKGRIIRGGIGIQVPREEAVSTEVSDGVHVDAVSPHSPADEAGVEPGDKIVELDGRPIRNFIELRSVVQRMEEGKKTTVKVQRDRRYISLPITIGAFEKLAAPTQK